MKNQFGIAMLWSLVFTASMTGLAASRDPDGLTPLHVAAGYGDLAKVKTLLKQGADLFSLDSRMGVSVLHKAVYSGKAEVVEHLLKEGALVDLQSPSNGNTPLHDALYFKPGSDTRVIEALLKFRPSLAIRNRAGLAPKDSAKLLNDQSAVALIEEYERTAFSEKGRQLMLAVKANDSEKVKRFVEHPDQPLEEADEQGFTPLIWAAREGFTAIVELLLGKGADPNRLDQWMKANAGHKAAFWGRAEAMLRLVKNGLDVNARGGYNGYTALHDAVVRGHLEVVKVLIQAGARKDVKGHDGKTARDIAKVSANADLLKALGE